MNGWIPRGARRAQNFLKRLISIFSAIIAVSSLVVVGQPAHAFCGFYVGKADTTLFNEASQVIMARDGDRTVISMLNDYKGPLSEFALVVPVPSVLKRDQINVGDARIFSRIDSYSAPRLAEYFDADPCEQGRVKAGQMSREMMSAAPTAASAPLAAAKLGVSVEATYTVGEYDIVILSAQQSDGLETWLKQNGYRIPDGAAKALAPYIKQDMKFFVAKVNLKKAGERSTQTLRPLQFAFESERFMLPVRLGMINSNGPQDLIVYMLTKNGRVESTNYRTVKLPANMDLPVFIRTEFKDFYKSFFDQQSKNENYRALFTEYFWDMNWCDPCAADPLSPDELRQVGVFWLGQHEDAGSLPQGSTMRRAPFSGAAPVMLTRLHVRYTKDSMPEDLMFQETRDRANFQTRYVLRHPFNGKPSACPQAPSYYSAVKRRQEKEAQALANLTGWNINVIRNKIPTLAQNTDSETIGAHWWSSIWKKVN